jgi:endonuclease/exonuclease/phosphatase (EEP) superfamily protein YafD
VFLLSGVSAFTGVVFLLARWSERLDAATHFAPFILAFNLLVLALVAFFRRWPKAPAVLAALFGVVMSAWLVVPEFVAAWTQPRVEPKGPIFKVVQFNVWHGNIDPAGTLAWILREDPDVVIIQEDAGQAIPLVAKLALAYPNGPDCLYPRPCDAAIYSRHPVTDTGKWKRRPLIWAMVHWQGREVPIVSTHHAWAWPAGEQQWQSRRAVALAATLPRRYMILAGDMNATPWSYSLRKQDDGLGLERRTRAMFSWPAMTLGPVNLKTPLFPIDHVYAGDGWETVSVRRGPRLGSDHFPIFVELTPR